MVYSVHQLLSVCPQIIFIHLSPPPPIPPTERDGALGASAIDRVSSSDPHQPGGGAGDHVLRDRVQTPRQRRRHRPQLLRRFRQARHQLFLRNIAAALPTTRILLLVVVVIIATTTTTTAASATTTTAAEAKNDEFWGWN